MNLSFLHPSDRALTAYAAGERSLPEQGAISRHVLRCSRCRARSEFVARTAALASALPSARAPRVVLERALAARAAGERRILPGPVIVGARDHAWGTAARCGVAAAVVAMAAGAMFVGRAREAGASSPESELQITPLTPRAGDSIHVRYQPAAGMFRGQTTLALRARFRAAGDEMYASRVPPQQIQRVAHLKRDSDGTYIAAFKMPDSFVFAALVVEDTGAADIDDNGDRLWEVLLHDVGGRPTFDALEQRLNDYMGRSWEEAYATARRLTEVYPDRIGSWELRTFFERTLLGQVRADSITAAAQPVIDSLIQSARQRPALSYDELQRIFARYYFRASLRGISGEDSVELAYWWTRINREYPRHEMVALRYAVDASRHFNDQPRALLDTLERIYPLLAPIGVYGNGRNLFRIAFYAAQQIADDSVYRRWYERSLSGMHDSTASMALALAHRPAYRQEGIRLLRSTLRRPGEAHANPRRLTETRADYQRRLQADRNRLLAALGRALVADGQTEEGLTTLEEAVRGGWDLEVFRDALTAHAAAGDSVAASAMAARLVVDPRTPGSRADSLTRAGQAHLGSARWDSVIVNARREQRASLLQRSLLEPLRGRPRLRNSSGDVAALSDLTAREPVVVVFWSRECGAAIEALPSLLTAIPRLRKGGTRVLFVIAQEPSAELTAYLKEKGVTWPVYHDMDGEAKRAFSNFGTPAYYVLDGGGRIRFDYANGEPELIAMVDALRHETTYRLAP